MRIAAALVDRFPKIMYSVIQFVGVIIGYVYFNLFSDLQVFAFVAGISPNKKRGGPFLRFLPQFLWVDLFLILPLSFTMGLTGPVKELR